MMDADMGFRQFMHMIAESLTAENVVMISYLCKDAIPNGRDLSNAIDFIEYFETKGWINSGDMSFLAEVLYRINRQDLLKRLPGVKNRRDYEENFLLAQNNANFSPFRIACFQLVDELTDSDFKTFRNLCKDKLSNRNYQRSVDVISLLICLEEEDYISEDDVEFFLHNLRHLDNQTPYRTFERLSQGDTSITLPKRHQSSPQLYPLQSPLPSDRRYVHSQSLPPLRPAYGSMPGPSTRPSFYVHPHLSYPAYRQDSHQVHPQHTGMLSRPYSFAGNQPFIQQQFGDDGHTFPGTQDGIPDKTFIPDNQDIHPMENSPNYNYNSLSQTNSRDFQGDASFASFPFKHSNSRGDSNTQIKTPTSGDDIMQQNYADSYSAPNREPVQLISALRIDDTHSREDSPTAETPFASLRSVVQPLGRGFLSNDTINDCQESVDCSDDDSDVESSLTKYSNMKQFPKDCHYPMNSRPCGVCLIIKNRIIERSVEEQMKEVSLEQEHENEHLSLPNAKSKIQMSSQKDVKKIAKLFKNFRFDVMDRFDLGHEEMMRVIKKCANDCGEYDCFICVIMSPGHAGYVYSADGMSLSFSAICKEFQHQMTPLLRNKPKLFLFQTCQADQRLSEDLISLTNNGGHSEPVLSEGSDMITLCEEDFSIHHFIAPPGKLHNPFIDALVRAFEQYYDTEDFCSLMLRVKNDVSLESFQAIPRGWSSLKKKVYFQKY